MNEILLKPAAQGLKNLLFPPFCRPAVLNDFFINEEIVLFYCIGYLYHH
jgi:hypothetical protein